jgi:hypothetical protein
MTFAASSPRPNHCPSCTCGAKNPLLVEARLRLQAAEYASALADGSNIDGDPGGIDAEHIAPFADYLPEALVQAGFRLTATFDDELRRLITTVYKRKDVGT